MFFFSTYFLIYELINIIIIIIFIQVLRITFKEASTFSLLEMNTPTETAYIARILIGTKVIIYILDYSFEVSLQGSCSLNLIS